MAHFKTGYHQREQVLDVKVAGDYKVGDMVSLAEDTITKVTALANADYIIAQSDMTMEYGHVPVESRDYRYSPKVAKSASKKKVAVFFISDKSDILLDSGETLA